MIIRKLFKFEGSHIVRNCSSRRCSLSNHGHSYKVEVFLKGSGLDNGGMIYDFGLLKGPVKDIIDSFDHCNSVWIEDEMAVEVAKKLSDRYVLMPINPTAEQYALMFLFFIDKILTNTVMKNGEKDVFVDAVKVHETDTGYAMASSLDLDMVNYNVSDFVFSDGVKKDWSDPDMLEKMQGKGKFTNPEPLRQI